MSPFEHQSLQIAHLQLATYVAADGIALIALAAAIVGGYLGFRNLRVVRLSLLLFLEQDLATRRRSFHDIEARMRRGGAGSALDTSLFEEAKESYFNTFERLASLALAQYFSDEELCRNYYHSLREVINAFPEDFTADTHYTKMLALYERWKDIWPHASDRVQTSRV